MREMGGADGHDALVARSIDCAAVAIACARAKIEIGVRRPTQRILAFERHQIAPHVLDARACLALARFLVTLLAIDVDAGPLVFSVQGRCAYETTFEYCSDEP